VQFQKKPKHFHWEGNVDVSAEMSKVFQTEKMVFQSCIELSHVKVTNSDTSPPPPPPPYCDRKRDNEGHVEQCSQLVTHFSAGIIISSLGLSFEELIQVRACCN